MNEIAIQLTPSVVADVRRHLENVVRPELTKDVSTYARGRTRAWLQYEAPLSKYRPYLPGLRDTKLWRWLSECWTGAGYAGVPEIGLALYGPIGITPHRDASYAHAHTLTVNLGTADWGWHPQRHGQNNDGLRWQIVPPGAVLKFDSKHKHASRNLDADRWAIVLWQAKRPIPRLL